MVVGLLLLATSLVFTVNSAEGAPGALDPSFGPSGAVYGGEGTIVTFLSTEGSRARALVLQPDGKLVAVGSEDPPQIPGFFRQIALVRYDADGALDSSFGDQAVETSLSNGATGANAAVLQPDGQIVVAGFHNLSPSGSEFVVARYDPNGALDTSFGSGGIVETPIPGETNAEAFGVVLQPDGKIVAGGVASDPGGSHSVLARYMPNGSLDASFGGGGGIVVSTVAGENGFDAVVLQPDGKILGVGQNAPLTRYTAGGTPDPTFGSGGVSRAPTAGVDALALQPDGKVVMAGGQSTDFALLRVNPDGTVDPTFGSDGVVETPMGSGSAKASAVAVQPDGRIVAAGTAQPSTSLITVARYRQDGSLDTTFGRNGVATALPVNTAEAGGTALGLQPDGKIDVAGWAEPNGWVQDEFALARFRVDSTLTVAASGAGSGVVTSLPAGIDCSSTCSASFTDTPVILNAAPSTGSVFAGWSGACTGTGPCTVTMTGDRSVTATFAIVTSMLTVAKAGKGHGTIASSPAGIRCGSTCSQTYSYGSIVTLRVKPASGSAFKGWSGACPHRARTCKLAMTQARSATATFGQEPACIVPKLKGKRLTLAVRMLKRAHCHTGKISRRYSNHTKGHVISQKPHAKRHLRNGTKIDLVVSKGRRP